MRMSRGGSFLFRILGRLGSTSVSTGLSEGLLCGLARIEDFIFTSAYRFTGRWYSPMANANEPVTNRGQLRISVCSVGDVSRRMKGGIIWTEVSVLGVFRSCEHDL